MVWYQKYENEQDYENEQCYENDQVYNSEQNYENNVPITEPIVICEPKTEPVDYWDENMLNVKNENGIDPLNNSRPRGLYARGNEKFLESQTKEMYLCNLCDASFKHAENLDQHINTIHDGNKPFQCLICDT